MKHEKRHFINSVNLNSKTDFPYLVLDVAGNTSCPRTPSFGLMHWHEDIQFIYVLNGTINVQTLDTDVRIHTGEAVFINKNVVHLIKRLGDCRYNSFIFPAYFLEFYTGSPAKVFVDSITANDSITLLPITAALDWQKDMLSLLLQLAEIEQNKTEFYTYEILVRLSELWLIMRKNIRIPAEKKENMVSLRMQKILRYIRIHYAEDLTLADLSKSADISKSECSRCFKLSLNTTPYKYLTEYRLSMAAQLLKNTNESIGTIAANVGFHQISHFGKCFREKTGCSPKAYRKKEK